MLRFRVLWHSRWYSLCRLFLRWKRRSLWRCDQPSIRCGSGSRFGYIQGRFPLMVSQSFDNFLLLSIIAGRKIRAAKESAIFSMTLDDKSSALWTVACFCHYWSILDRKITSRIICAADKVTITALVFPNREVPGFTAWTRYRRRGGVWTCR